MRKPREERIAGLLHRFIRIKRLTDSIRDGKLGASIETG